jgi:hypothetical protein
LLLLALLRLQLLELLQLQLLQLGWSHRPQPAIVQPELPQLPRLRLLQPKSHRAQAAARRTAAHRGAS